MKKVLCYPLAIFTIVLTVVLSACDESTSESNKKESNSWNELRENVVVLNDQASQYVETYVNDSIIIFKKDTPDNLIPPVGKIMYMPISDKTPYGYMGKIYKIEKDDSYKVFTESAPLDEVFGNLSIDGGIEIIDSIEEVLDGEGKPIEYELVDTVFQNKVSTSTKSRTGEFYLQDKLVRFPFKIYEKKDNSEYTEINGSIYVGFKDFSLNLDINNNETSFIECNMTPCAGFNLSAMTRLKGKEYKEEIRIGQIRFRASIPTPAGIPIIMPITFYVYATYGAKGEFNTLVSLKEDFYSNCKIHNKTGQWIFDHKEYTSNYPWAVSEFEAKGELFAGLKLGLLVGLYSATSGIGINIIPNYSLGCSASITSEDILNINPMVDFTIKCSSEAYCVANLFGKNLGKATIQFPDCILYNERVYLLPQYSEFNVTGNGKHGEISYRIDQNYFLKDLGFKHGLTIFDEDNTTELETVYPSASKTDKRGFSYYEYRTSTLAGGKTYYASPTIYGLNRKFHGEKHEFNTESTYNLRARCSGKGYDVISINFSLDDIKGKRLNYTTESRDYDGGSAFRVHITGEYDSSSHTLSGQFDFYFYDDPDQKRVDGFKVNLSSGDSGYVGCSKIVDNGGCYSAVRIINQDFQSTKAGNDIPLFYDENDEDDDCNIGIFNKYQK